MCVLLCWCKTRDDAPRATTLSTCFVVVVGEKSRSTNVAGAHERSFFSSSSSPTSSTRDVCCDTFFRAEIQMIRR